MIMLDGILEIKGRTYLSSRALAEKYKVTTKTIFQWTQRNFLPKPIRLSNKPYYDMEKVETAMSRGE